MTICRNAHRFIRTKSSTASLSNSMAAILYSLRLLPLSLLFCIDAKSGPKKLAKKRELVVDLEILKHLGGDHLLDD